MDVVWPNLFRGITVGWPGNKALQKVRRTPTSTDPLVATFFAMECIQHGDAVVCYARWEKRQIRPIIAERIRGLVKAHEQKVAAPDRHTS